MRIGVLVAGLFGVLLLAAVVHAQCPEGCACLDKATAEKYGLSKLCSDKPCGETTKGELKYCFKTYTCPDNCYCLTEEEAKEKFTCPTLCGDAICGYDEKTPKYCFRDNCTVSVAYPFGCECLTDEEAKEKGYTEPCGDYECGLIGDNVVKHCYKKPYECPEGCKCLTDEEVRKYLAEGYVVEKCGEEKCSEKGMCYKISSPTCPAGCECLSDEEVKKYESSGIKLERCTSQPCGDGKYCYRKVEEICPAGCECLSKEEGYAKGMEFCQDSAGNLIRCGVIDAEHGVYKYCFREAEKCHFDREKSVCSGYCESGECGFSADYQLCVEDCKMKYEECLKGDVPEEECKKVYEECWSGCNPSCECKPITCPAGCECLNEETVKKYQSAGYTVERCAAESCIAGNYCYRVTPQKCHFDYEKEQCVGGCEVGQCNLNTIVRDPKTGKVVYGECACKPVNVCPAGCECMPKEKAEEAFSNPQACNPNPCAVEKVKDERTGEEWEVYSYCFKEGEQVCHYDRESGKCVGGCERGECTLLKDSYGNPFCSCLTKITQTVLETSVVERALPPEASPLTCIPVKLYVKPASGVTGMIITENYPPQFRFASPSIAPSSYGNGTAKWLLMDKNGLKEQEIEYKLCLPRNAAGEYYFNGIWETDTNAGTIVGDTSIKVMPSRTNWPPCPVTDSMLLNYITQWSEGKLSDLELLQVVEVWDKGC